MQTLQSTITPSKAIQSHKVNNNNILANALIDCIACNDSVSNICIKYNIARQAFYKCKGKLDLMTKDSLYMRHIITYAIFMCLMLLSK
ncbi:hypothetical protein XJ32_09365 [Helicobacter bilis]|uniref:Uncharacterized protein n=1 Tax=Helicobacter bilis TaxID=37372 RepID=A0A1Q2LIN3_9HELI|nr:hypothetical protein XJ32_09365 [Helicobacter bilis]